MVEKSSFCERLLLFNLILYCQKGFPDLDNITIKDLVYYSGLPSYSIRRYLKVLSDKGKISVLKKKRGVYKITVNVLHK